MSGYVLQWTASPCGVSPNPVPYALRAVHSKPIDNPDGHKHLKDGQIDMLAYVNIILQIHFNEMILQLMFCHKVYI